MTLSLPNGIGASTGSALVTSKNLRMSGVPYFASSVIGNDSNSGLSRQDPMATIGAAFTAASSGDWIVLAADHDETLTGTLDISKELVIVGEGSSGGFPTAKIRNDQAANPALDISVLRVQLVNILFPAQAQACSAATVVCTAARFYMSGCKFELDGNSAAAGLLLDVGSGIADIQATTFLSTSARQALPVNNDPPVSGLSVTSLVTELRIDGSVFDGGEIGFSGYAFDASAPDLQLLSALGVSFLNGADYTIKANGVGFVQVGTSTGDVTGDW